MELATSIGITISEFWEITPKELHIALNGYRKRKVYEAEEYNIKFKNEQMMLTIQAYQISRWVWAKNLDLRKILKDVERKKEMTDDEMLKQVNLLNSLFGGEVESDGKE